MSAVDRRSLAKGVAWTLPAITIAAAAPSLAASPVTRVTGWAQKCPGASDVPGGWPKHGYVVHLDVTPTPEVVVPITVLLNNGKYGQIVTDATPGGVGWSFVVDAGSSPSKLTVTVLIDGTEHTVHVKAHPHCGGPR